MSKLLLFCLCISFSLSAQLSDKEILTKIDQHKPSSHSKVPAFWKGRIGTSLAEPKYSFSDKPIIIEAVQKTKKLGYSALKLFVPENKIDNHGNSLTYSQNSDWRLTKNMKLQEVLAHRYFKEVFSSGLKIFALDICHGWDSLRDGDPKVSLSSIEQEMFSATCYLLKQYKDKNITFIIQNWEGDWMLRGSFDDWSKNGVPYDWQKQADLFVSWTKARQRGVEKARQKITNSQSRVYHAVEANKVLDGLIGIPSIASYVLPKVKVDMASWSAYDGIKYGNDNGLKMYRGFQYLKSQLEPSDYMKGKKVVYIGEIALQENSDMANSPKKTSKLWDTWMGVFMALDAQYVFQWALYDNEINSAPTDGIYRNQNLKGMWLIRADGTKSFTQKYFDRFNSRTSSK